MKKILLVLAVMLTSLSSFAQKDTKALGLRLLYGTEVKNMGVGIFGQYHVTDNIRLEGGIDSYFKHNNTSAWGINANAQYFLHLNPQLSIYPIVGFGFSSWNFDYTTADGKERSENKLRFGANFGVGAQYELGKRTFASFEIKDQVVSDYDQVNFALGVGFRF